MNPPSPPLHPLEGAGATVLAEKVAFPPGGRIQLPMQPELFSGRVFSQIFVFLRWRARKAQALLTHPAERLASKLPCSLDWNSLPHPSPRLSAPLSGTGSFITAPWSGDSLQRTSGNTAGAAESVCDPAGALLFPGHPSVIVTTLHSS